MEGMRENVERQKRKWDDGKRENEEKKNKNGKKVEKKL